MHSFRKAARLAAVVLTAALAGCGGGGGSPATGPLLPTLSEDSTPTGARIDVSALNLFPAQAGDTWVYAFNDGASTTRLTRAVTSGPDAAARYEVTATDLSGSWTSEFRNDSAGVLEFDPFGAQGVWPGLYAALPSYMLVATPVYPVNGERKLVRQGDLGADLDGDGKNDYFRAEISLVFRGFETLTVLGATTEVAHFTNRFSLTTKVTRDSSSRTLTTVEEAYLAPNLGLVRATGSTVRSDGVFSQLPYTMDLTAVTMAGVRVDASGRSRAVAVGGAERVFDATRNVYYVSNSEVAGQGNRIATVDAATGAVVQSAPVGSSPGPMDISSDGNALLVGLTGSGEVLRLGLPDLQELGRVRLPVDPFWGQLLAEDIAASPVDPNVFAVSLIRPQVSPRHGGVALVRNLVVQPVRTQEHTGSNRIAFGAEGQWLYGYNNETTEFGLRRIEVLADGLAERKVVAAEARFYTDIDVRDGLIVLGMRVFRADDTLDLLGTVVDADRCIKLSGVNKLACRSTLDLTRLRVFDATNFSLLASPTFVQDALNTGSLLAGRLGQVAVVQDNALVLLTAPSLR